MPKLDATDGPYLLELLGIKKSFGGAHALRGVSLSIGKGEALGLAGENGAGKSTLLNILGGVHQPTSGEMRWESHPYLPASPRDAARCGLAFIHQELNLFPNLTIAENLLAPRMRCRSFLGLNVIDRRTARQEAKEALAQVGLDRDSDTPLARLSAGERQLVEIAKALRQSAKLILFDEPTTSLSHREKDRLFQLITGLKSRGIAMIYISHALDDLFQICGRIAVLRDGAMVGEGGASELSQGRLISMMIGRDQSQAFPERNATPGDKVLLHTQSYRTRSMRAPVDLDVREGEVVGVAGLMGAGRTEFLRGLFGLDRHMEGFLECEGRDITRFSPRRRIRCGMALLTESRREDGLFLPASIATNMLIPSLSRVSRPPLGFIRSAAARGLVQDMREQVHLDSSAKLGQPVATLSGGNQQKTIFGRWLIRQPRIFILDEPTRGVDVGAKFEIYTLIDRLAATGAAVLLASSEIEELIGVCDRIIVMRNGRLVREFRQSQFDKEAILEAAIKG